MPMGVDCRRFQPSLALAEARLLICAGRLVPEKNLPLLFDSFAVLFRRGSHDYRLAAAGDSMLRQHWTAECSTRLLRAGVGGGSRDAVAEGIDGDDEESRGIEEILGAGSDVVAEREHDELSGGREHGNREFCMRR